MKLIILILAVNLSWCGQNIRLKRDIEVLFHYFKKAPKKSLIHILMPEGNSNSVPRINVQTQNTDLYFESNSFLLGASKTKATTTKRVKYEKICNEYGKCFWGNPEVIKKKLGIK